MGEGMGSEENSTGKDEEEEKIVVEEIHDPVDVEDVQVGIDQVNIEK